MFDKINFKLENEKYIMFNKGSSKNDGDTKILIYKNISEIDLLKDFSNFKIFFENEPSLNSFIKINCQNENYFKKRLKTFLEEFSDIDFFIYPNELFLVGGFLNVILDKKIDMNNKFLKLIDIDFYIISKRPFKIISKILKSIEDKFGKNNVKIIKYDMQLFKIFINNMETCVSFFITSSLLCSDIIDILKSCDFSHIKSAYDGNNIILTKDSWQSIYSKKTNFYPNVYRIDYINRAPLRIFKTLSRGYQINGYKIHMEQLLKNEDVQNFYNQCNEV